MKLVARWQWKLLLVFAGLALSCSRADDQAVEAARLHSQQIMDAIGTPVAREYFDTGTFDMKQVDVMFKYFADSCDMAAKVGGLAGTRYTKGVGRPDVVSFLYIYQCGAVKLRFICHYDLHGAQFKFFGYEVKPADSTHPLPKEPGV